MHKKTNDSGTTANYISTIDRLKSISAAAEALGISQPALSAYLKKLEQDMGVMLFDRSSKPLRVTEAGKAYLEYIEKQVALERELAQNLADIGGLNIGELTIGGAAFFNISYVPPAVAEFHRLYPNVNIEIVDGKVPELAKHAYNGSLDLFISPIADDDDRFVYEKLLDEKIFLCVPEDWKVDGNEGGTVKALPEGTYIVLKEDQHIGQKMRQLFAKFDFTPEHTVVAEQTMTSMGLVLAGVGACLITESSLLSSGMQNRIQHFLPDKDICHREMYVAYPRNKYLSNAAAEFIRILKGCNK